MMTGPFDLGARLFMMRYWVGGYYQSSGTVNVDVWRRMIPIVSASLALCWISTPFEIAKKAFIADRKFPENLRRNYTSSFNALMRLPFLEGPAFLFKNSLPTMLGVFLETFGLFYFSDYFLDYSLFLHMENGVPYAPLKAVSFSLAILLTGIMAYPFKYFARNLIELYPKDFGGEMYKFQYRKALIEVAGNSNYSSNYKGMSRYFWLKGPRFFITLWVAERLGLFRSWRTSYLSFPGINVFSDIHG